MNVRMIDVGAIKPHPNNPRFIKDKDFERLISDLQKDGFVENLVVNSVSNHILSGNMRYRAALELLNRGDDRFKVVPVYYVTIHDEKREYELMIKLNNHHGRWDSDALANLGFEIDELKEFGFQRFEIDTLMGVNIDKRVIESGDEKPKETSKAVKQHRRMCPHCGNEL